MANIVYIACSIDGYIARSNGDLDWLINIPNENNNDYGYNDFIKRVDGIIIGRKTFETVLSFSKWPYDKPVFILSKKINEVPMNIKDKAVFYNGEIKAIIDQLNKRGMNNLYIDGGKTIQSFLKEDLIDEMIITTVSTILGSGIKLFEEMNKTLEFECEKIEQINKYLVKKYYKRKR
jgi:dihydrofolate reductase